MDLKSADRCFGIDKKGLFKVLLTAAICVTVPLVIYTNHTPKTMVIRIRNITDGNVSPQQIHFQNSSFGNMRLDFNIGSKLTTTGISKVENEEECKHYRFLVYKCDGSRGCGGWADREKGIVTSFLLALLTNRTFVIRITKPCGLMNILQPSIYDWNRCGGFLSKIKKKDLVELNFIDKGKLLREMLAPSFNFDSKWTKQVVVLRINALVIDKIRLHDKSAARLSWLLTSTNEETVQVVLQSLFRPREMLLKDIQNFKNANIRGKRLICCHIRHGKNPSIPADGTRKVTPNENVIFDFLKKYDKDNGNVIYVASDSDDVRIQAKRTLDSYINVNRSIIHVDRFNKQKLSTNESCEGFYTAVMEQYILSQCDTLVLTPSGFGFFAAYMRGVSDNLFLYHAQNHKVLKSDLTSIQTVFNYF